MLFLALFVLTGCSLLQSSKKRQQLLYEKLAAPYNQITLKESNILDVKSLMQRSQKQLGLRIAGTELLSKSKNTIASSGQSKDGYITWFNMVTFHEYRMNAVRKAFFAVNDKGSSLSARVTQSLRFDCRSVLPAEILTGQYTSESARRLDILKFVFSAVRSDIGSLDGDTNSPGQSNQTLSACGFLLNQTFEVVLLKLESSPVLTARLSESGGVLFDHISFDKGRIRMTTSGDIATIHIRLGSLANKQ